MEGPLAQSGPCIGDWKIADAGQEQDGSSWPAVYRISARPWDA